MQSGRGKKKKHQKNEGEEREERLMAYNWWRGRTCEAVQKKRGGEIVRDHTRF